MLPRQDSSDSGKESADATRVAPAFTALLSTVEDFELGPVVGEGGMARVHLARHRVSGEQVALKFLETDVDQAFMDRFQREVSAAASIQHDNVCRVIGYGSSPSPFIALEYIDGDSLKTVLRNHGTMPPELAAEIIAGLLAALAAAHAQSIVHRDIKPANIMFTTSGVLKLVDFGISKAATDTTVTQTGSVIGTPQYMSPEQVRGEALDQRSDLFSVGVLLHELFTGASPFRHETMTTVLMRVMKMPIPSLLSVAPHAPHELRRVHDRLLERDINLRYQTAHEALADLMPYLTEARARHGQLLQRLFSEGKPFLGELRKARSHSLVARADVLTRAGQTQHAADLALYAAHRADPSSQTVITQLKSWCEQTGQRFDPTGDPRFERIRENTRMDEKPATRERRLAEELLTAGYIFQHAVHLELYLREKPNDHVARMRLETLTGVARKTGSHPTPRPVENTRSSLQLATRKPWVGQPEPAASRLPTSVTPSPLRTESFPRQDAQLPGVALHDHGDGVRIPRVWLAISAGAACAAVLFFAVRSTLDAASQHAARQGEDPVVATDALQDDLVWGLQRGSLTRAREALARGDGLAAVENASRALEGDPPLKMYLEALWTRGNAYLLLNQRAMARADFESYLDSARVSDDRRSAVQAALERMRN